jgi:hypothetical protein
VGCNPAKWRSLLTPSEHPQPHQVMSTTQMKTLRHIRATERSRPAAAVRRHEVFARARVVRRVLGDEVFHEAWWTSCGDCRENKKLRLLLDRHKNTKHQKKASLRLLVTFSALILLLKCRAQRAAHTRRAQRWRLGGSTRPGSRPAPHFQSLNGMPSYDLPLPP